MCNKSNEFAAPNPMSPKVYTIAIKCLGDPFIL